MRPKITREEAIDGFKFYKACREINLVTGLNLCKIYKMLGAVPERVSQIRKGRLRAPAGWYESYKGIMRANKNAKTTI